MGTIHNYDAIVFDLDGTLIDSADIKTWAFGRLYQQHGQAIVDEVISYHLSNQGVSRFEKFRYWQEKLLGEPYTESIGNVLSQQLNELVTDAVISAPYIAGAQEFLESHCNHLPLFVASATPEAELRKIITERGMARYFHAVFGAPARKAEILQQIISKNRWEPHKVLMVGDAAADYEGAQASGTGFVAIAEGEHPSCFKDLTMQLPDLTRLEQVICE